MQSVGSQQGRKMPNLKQDPETDEHLMFQCRAHRVTPHRLELMEEIMRQKGCRTSKEDLIRGYFGPIGYLRQAFTLLATYIFINWKGGGVFRYNHKMKITITIESQSPKDGVL
ncbi:hypothetical protein OUZ56_024057 [Daphnia magna]|uniref:Uncharacterized protein n=1 Tax=Daphnia magna TaxID=35525 RepID=A0ABR0B010_9CRUS|nr:hypothetical protein OUZ56_024057 [Daphnia magna]